MSDNRPDPPPETCEATIPESSSQPSSRVKQGTWKFAKKITKKLSKRFKCSRKRIPAIQNVERQGASSSENIQVLDVPSGIEETPGPKSVGAELHGAHEALEHVKTPWRPAQPVISAVNTAPAGLTAVDNFQTNYLQPLKIFDTAIDKIADVHPYAKMALGVLSAAAKIILAQAERDESVDRLLQKLEEVYGFITQDDNLSKVESMRDVIGKIAQQTRVCPFHQGILKDEKLL
ncbi:uncharacterized protein EDB93DRAFT_1108078 [Suillus bovinus]|uniref:uncharacterized protein n=1 Tax=Suillus bovinus TaxID=48563 RepID=UPI001B8719F8|nr:uncharacterized protein EDB93DRAFT_1108078 [Suillus bovinus]KAG2131616.1 hypothetical protein EDB93DRAFT_1108078 [Suillus bovinus]